MQQAVDSLKKSNLLYPSYALKLALMKIDSTNAEHQKAGQELLKALAEDDKNPQQDAALYYAGIQARDHKDLTTAKQYFTKAIKIAPEHSGWRQTAQKQLDALSN